MKKLCRSKKLWACAGGALIGSAVLLAVLKKQWAPEMTLQQALSARKISASAPSAYATWPWPGVQSAALGQGLKHWMAKDARDGTVLDLLEFDFVTNPKMRWEIYDQDQHDATPGDNRVNFWKKNVAAVSKEINARGTGEVLAAWNGAFFGYYPEVHEGHHVSPVVLNGKVLYNTANHRWVFGVKRVDDKPRFGVLHQPGRQEMAAHFDYAAGSLQCLVKEGKPLQMEPFPATVAQIKPQPWPSTPQEAGHIPKFDHMRTCRASIGWSKDNRYLYLLLVKEPDSEGPSSAALTTGVPLAGGWTVADVQRFWLSKGVWGAVNSDAGDVAQLVFRNPNHTYTMVPPKMEGTPMRRQLGPGWKGALQQGGSLMYFYVKEQA